MLCWVLLSKYDHTCHTNKAWNFHIRNTLPFKIGHPMRHVIKLYEFGRIDFEITACNHYTFLFNHHLIKMLSTLNHLNKALQLESLVKQTLPAESLVQSSPTGITWKKPFTVEPLLNSFSTWITCKKTPIWMTCKQLSNLNNL